MNNDSELDVTIKYDRKHEFVILNFAQDGQLISIGFTIPEAQALQTNLMDVITTAILEKLDILPSGPPSETRH